ncbi:hypothetical protein ABU162_08915 [Paenibacillus thiaminolyticus]|uniref:hypothetical protein n=1 Tax=Paenibacillus thiaminolyticus TaxID=49283 RepID=UPI0035A6B1DD
MIDLSFSLFYVFYLAASSTATSTTPSATPCPPPKASEPLPLRRRAVRPEEKGNVYGKGDKKEGPYGGADKTKDDILEVNPKDINFAQISINKSFDTPDGKLSITKVIRQGAEQVKDFPPISVIDVKGQLVARDGNSRLYVARSTKAEKIKVKIETDIDSFKDLTKRLRNNNLPNNGSNKLPTPR